MNAYTAKVVLDGFVKGVEVSRELLVDAIKTSTLPKINAMVNIQELKCKSTAYIERFEPDAEKQWVEVDELAAVLEALTD
ncbi:MAG: hypothetical protein Q4A15_10535 [Prevotellaceae bacterium]|nr:hypothetical protein [Prevotellaceae bacterium]